MPKQTIQSSDRRELFDPEMFRQELAKHDSPIPSFKTAIRQAREKLNERFKSRRKIDPIIRDLAWFIDQILISAWNRYDWAGDNDISLLAVGGYGRGALHPYSDIDIQILLKRNNHNKYKANIEKFLMFLWDINLEVGQSVRTIKENKQEAAKDITVATSLMESRHLVGNEELHAALMDQLTKKNIWNPKAFFAAKKSEQDNRHRKNDDIEYALEPNIKEAPGGLRDIQTIGWIAKRYFNAVNLKALHELGFLQKNEYNELVKAREFLWKIRYALHMTNERREDRLLFEHQRTLAEMFGYKDDAKSLGIEKLMQQYYRVVLTVRELNDVLLQLFDEEIIRSGERTKIKPINNRFQIHNNYIEAVHTRVFRQTPSALLEIFVLLAQNSDIEGIRASTIRLIRNARSLIGSEFRRDIRNRSLFMELLRSPHHMVARLRQMKRYGILQTYLPEFGKIVGKMQHDLFHIYTVDDHTLQVIENMRRFRHDEAKEKYPLAHEIYRHLPKVELLYIAGLYHDMAKGRGGDHSKLGERDAQVFCRRHYLGKWDTALVGWLVRNHLTMSAVAQREDIQDPDTIRDFANFVGDKIRLDYLYTLTVADINATNPKLWNTWRASLLRQLYISTREFLTRSKEEIVGKSDWIKENQNKALELLKSKGFSTRQVKSIWGNPDEEYFLRVTPEDIAWHTESIAAHTQSDAALIKIKDSIEHRYEGATQVFIYSPNSNFLFANIANAFDRLNLNIQDASIFNSGQPFCIKVFMVLEENGNPIGKNPARLEEIHNTLHDYVKFSGSKPCSIKGRTSRKLRHFTRNTQTCLTNDEHFPYSTLEVLCPDRPGLLAQIANIFVEMDITLHNAKITTLGENVEDVFFITDHDNRPLLDEAFNEKLQSSIRTTLDHQVKH